MSTVSSTAATCARHNVPLSIRLTNAPNAAPTFFCPVCESEHNPRLTMPSGRCGCPTCTVSKSLRELDTATNAWMEREAEVEMSYVWLLDEVREVLKDPKLPVSARRRLAKALEVCRDDG